MSTRADFVMDIFYNGRDETWENYAIKYGFKNGKQANDFYRWFIKNGAIEGEWEPDIEASEIDIPDILQDPVSDIANSREYQEFLAWKVEQENKRTYVSGNYLLLGCTHVPFHNKKFFEALLRLNSDIKPIGLILAGDFLDMNSLSAHDVGKKPIEGVTLDWEYQEGNKALDALQSSWNSEIKHFIFGNHCFVKDTELLTEEGWKLVQDINSKIPIKFASYNLKTDSIEYDFPLDITIKKYIGEIHNYRGLKIDVSVTPEHKMLVKKQNKSDYEFKLSKDITDKCFIFKTAANNHKDDYNISDNKIKLAAWIYTDGNLKKKCSAISIYQSKLETSNRIEQILIEEKLQYNKKTRNRNITKICETFLKNPPLPQNEFYINAEQIDFIKDKYNLDSWIFNLSKRQVDIFINELVLGAGSKHKSSSAKSWILYGKKEFLDQVQILCISNGYSASISKFRNKDYRLNIHVDKSETKLNSVSKHENFTVTQYNDIVWCPTMKNGTVICRRNGKVSIQGNCDRYLRHMAKTDNAKYGSALLSPTIALSLSSRGFVVHENWKAGVVYLGKHLEVIHGENCSIHAAKKHMDVLRTSVVHFHIHRVQMYMEGNTSAWALGWGGDINSPAFSYATKAMKTSWKNAAGVVHIDENGGYHVIPIIWHNDMFYYGNKCYK